MQSTGDSIWQVRRGLQEEIWQLPHNIPLPLSQV